MKSIAVMRALPGLGDLLCGVPALRALRGAYPDARISYVGLERTGPVLARFDHYIDELLPFPGWPGLPEEPFEPVRAEAFLDAVRKRGFDLALQLHDSGPASAKFVLELGAERVAGYGPGLLDPAYDLHEIHRPLRVLEAIGVAPRGDHLELPVDDDDKREAAEVRPDAPYAVLHPGARRADRRWPAERFAAVADGLAERGLVPVLTGTPADADVVAAVADAARADVVELIGRTSLGGLGVLLAGAWVTVTNDTGVSHLAAADGAPSVDVFVSSDAARWAPLDRARHRSLPEPAPAPVPGDADPPRGSVRDVGVDEVLREVDALLEPRQLDRGAAIHHHV